LKHERTTADAGSAARIADRRHRFR
jgi:hypothetical protein